MNTSNRTRLSFESLETRETPSVTASVVNGSLAVGGSATVPGSQIRIQGTSFEGTSFSVFDGVTKVGDYAVSKDINVNLGAANDKVNIEFGGFASREILKGNLNVNLGGGDDEVLIGFGGARNVTVNGGNGDDQISFQRFGTFGNLEVNSGNGSKDVVNVFAETDVTGTTNIRNAESVLIGTRSGGDINVMNSVAMNVDFFGRTTGDLTVMGGGGSFTVGGSVGGDAVYLNNFFGTTPAKFLIQGSVTGSAIMVGTVAADTLEVSQFATVGNLFAYLGGGNDTYTRTTGAVIGSAYVNGGAGQDVYIGPSNPAGQTLVRF
jgi:hypothetical protein